MSNVIKHPKHYAYSKYEPKDVIRSWGLNFNLGNAIKYIARAGRKDDIVQDLEKAKQYLEFEIEAIKAERENKTSENVTLQLEEITDTISVECLLGTLDKVKDYIRRVGR